MRRKRSRKLLKTALAFVVAVALVFGIAPMPHVTEVARAEGAGFDYLDANGNVCNTVTDDIEDNNSPTVLTGSEPELTTGWYVVNSDINYSSKITLNGDVHIILVNGKTMNIGTMDSVVNGNAFDGYTNSCSLSIYGQSLDNSEAGHICAYSSSVTVGGSALSSYTQNGGNVSLYSKYNVGIYGYVSNNDGWITLNGGSLSISSPGADDSISINTSVVINGGTLNTTKSISSISGHITLGWRNTTDSIKVNRYNGTVAIAEGKKLSDGVNEYSGTLTAEQVSRIAGKTLITPEAASSLWGVGNDGSEQKPYVISTAADLDKLARFVNNGTSDFSGKHFVLENDITYSYTTAWNATDSTENNYTEIGKNNSRFNGKFDGKGFTISGIRIYKSDLNSSGHGIFGEIGSDGDVKNVVLADTRVTGIYSFGGIAGKNYGAISNCKVQSDVMVHGNASQTDAAWFGGIVGDDYGTVNGCESSVVMSVSGENGGMYIGGIAGESSNIDRTGSECSPVLSDNRVIGAVIPDENTCGIVVGWNKGALENNYYHACTYGSTANATGKGCWCYTDASRENTHLTDVTDNDGAVPVFTVRSSDAIAVTSSGGTPICTIGSTKYYKEGTTVTLTVTASASTTGMKKLTATGGTLAMTDTAGVFSLNMPASDVMVSVADDSPTISVAEATYTGSALQPAVTVRDGDTVLTQDTDYTVSYNDNINAGTDTATATITGKGWYVGSASADFSIEKKSVTPSLSGSVSKVYDGTTSIADTSGLSIDLDGIVERDRNKVGVSSATFNYSSSNVGVNKSVVVENIVLGGDKSGNYELSTNTVSSTANNSITPATLTVTAKDKTIHYGDEPSYNGVDYSGFVTGEGTDDLGGNLRLVSTYSRGDDAGTYTITPDGLSSENYRFNYVDGTLTVDPKEVNSPVISLSSDVFTYDGNPKKPAVTVLDESGNTISEGEYTVSYANHINAARSTDALAPTVTITDKSGGNYTVGGIKKFTINKAENPAVIRTEVMVKKGSSIDLSTLVSGAMGTVSFTKTGTDGDNKFALSGTDNTVTLESDADGSCTFKATITGTSNYENKEETITITATSLDTQDEFRFTATDLEKTWGDGDFTFRAEGAVADSEVTYTSDTPSVATVDNDGKVHILSTGTAIITANASEVTDRYAAADASYRLNVKKAKISITAMDQSIYVGGTVPNLTSPVAGTHYTISGLKSGDVLGGTITMSYQSGGATVVPDVSKAGTYDIVVSGATAPAGGNYEEIEYIKGTLKINTKPGGGTGGGSGTGGGGSGGSGSTPATSPAPSAAPSESPSPSAEPGTSPAPTIVEQRTETTNNPDGTTTTTTTTLDSEGTKTTEAETVLTDGSVEKITDVVKSDGSTEKVVETEHPDGSSEKTVDIVNADGSTETISEKVKPNGASEKVTDIEKADGTTIHEDVKTTAKGKETSYRSETLPTGDKTVTEQVKQPSGDFSKTTTKTTVKKDDEGNVIDTSVKITVEVKTGAATTRTSFSVISSEPVAKMNALGSIAKLAGKKKNQVALTKATTNAKSGKVTITKTVKADGVTYKVVTLKKGMLKGNKKKPTKVKFQATGVTKVEKGAFKAMAKKGTIYVSGTKKQFKKLKKLIVKSGLPKGVKIKRV